MLRLYFWTVYYSSKENGKESTNNKERFPRQQKKNKLPLKYIHINNDFLLSSSPHIQTYVQKGKKRGYDIESQTFLYNNFSIILSYNRLLCYFMEDKGNLL